MTWQEVPKPDFNAFQDGRVLALARKNYYKAILRTLNADDYQLVVKRAQQAVFNGNFTQVVSCPNDCGTSTFVCHEAGKIKECTYTCEICGKVSGQEVVLDLDARIIEEAGFILNVCQPMFYHASPPNSLFGLPI